MKIRPLLPSSGVAEGQGATAPGRNSAPLLPPKWNYILYRGLWRAAILSPSQPPLLIPQPPLPPLHFEKSGYAPASIEFHIIGATLVPQPLRLYNILCDGTPLIQLSIEKHAKPRLCNCNFTPHVTIYVENFVHRNPLIRDKIVFQALFLDADQVYFLRYKHVNSATVFLLWHDGLFTRSDLDKNSCAYNLRTFEFNHFGITWIMTRLYSFKFMINNKPH